MQNTTAFDVKRAVLAALQVSPDLADVQVSYGLDTRDPARSWLFLGNINWVVEAWEATHLRKKEQYTIDVVVNVQMPGADPADAEAEAQRIMGIVEAWLIANPRQSLARSTVTSFTPIRAAVFPYSDGQEAHFEAKISVEAHK